MTLSERDLPGVTYSLGTRLGGGGIGWIAYQAVLGSWRAGRLRQLLAASLADQVDLGGVKVQSWGSLGRVARLLTSYLWSAHTEPVLDDLYDRWARSRLAGGPIFHVWHGHGLRSIRAARERGMVTILERASTHPRYQASILSEEYRRWGRSWRPWPWYQRRLLDELEEADHVVVPSKFAYRTFLEAGYASTRLHLVPYGVDTRRFAPRASREERPFRILFSGQLSLRKGVPYLLQAWKQLGWRDAELVLAGRVLDEIRPTLRSYRSLAGVQIVGHRGSIEGEYNRADVFAFPTLEEGSALVVLEAMASGLPVVTTPNAGAPLEDGVQGLLVPIRDPGALASALGELRSKPERRRSMSLEARAHALRRSWDAYRRRLLRVYDTIAP